jgi:hypothetical protein
MSDETRSGSAGKTEDETLADEKTIDPGKRPAGARGQVSNLHILRAAILMSADSMLADLRTIRDATTIQEAQAPVNSMIDRVLGLSKAAENAAE